MRKLKEEIEKLQEKQMTEAGKNLKCMSERLVKKRDSLKEQEVKASCKKFLEEVVLPGCVLCPRALGWLCILKEMLQGRRDRKKNLLAVLF